MLSPSAPLITPSSRSGIDGPGAGVVAFDALATECAARPSMRSTTKPTGAPRVDNDDPRRLVERSSAKPEQAPQARPPAGHVHAGWRARAGSAAPSGMRARLRHAHDLADIVQLETEQLVRDRGTQRNARSPFIAGAIERRRLSARPRGRAGVACNRALAPLSHCGAGCLRRATRSPRSPRQDLRRRAPVAWRRRPPRLPRCRLLRPRPRPAAHRALLPSAKTGWLRRRRRICSLPVAISSISLRRYRGSTATPAFF